MKIIRIYHADSSYEFHRQIAQAIRQSGDMELIGSAQDGRRAEIGVRELEPDVLITCLALPFLDGLELIQRVQKLAHRPRILVVTHLERDFCIEEASRLGADYFMAKPCSPSIVLERARMLVEKSGHGTEGFVLPSAPSPMPILHTLLRHLGVPPHLNGYRYIISGVHIALERGISCITKDLYPQISAAHNTNATSVERAIRHAIACTWQRPATTVRNALFPDGERPSNSLFLQRLASACDDQSWEEL